VSVVSGKLRGYYHSPWVETCRLRYEDRPGEIQRQGFGLALVTEALEKDQRKTNKALASSKEGFWFSMLSHSWPTGWIYLVVKSKLMSWFKLTHHARTLRGLRPRAYLRS